MKKLLQLALFTLVLQTTTIGLGQSEETPKKNPVNKEVDKVNKTSEEVNATVENTSVALKSTAANTKEAINTIGELFGSGKGKNKNKEKEVVIIKILQVTYDDERLNTLSSRLTKVKGVKRATKSFANDVAVITIESKENADVIWQKIAKDVRKPFKMIEISGTNMLLQLSEVSEKP